MEDKDKVQKLFAVPVEETLTFPDRTTKKLWLHPLKHPVEDIVCLGIYKETYELQRDRGCDEEICKEMAVLAHAIQRLMFSARVSNQSGSEKLFKDSQELLRLGPEVFRLNESYFKAFEAKDEQELGESSRVSS